MEKPTDNLPFGDILQRHLDRRQVLKASLAGTLAALFGNSSALGSNPGPALGFDPVPTTRSDTVTVPRGYRVQAILPWGEPITGSYPPYNAMTGNSGEEQEQQVGSHHDGMHFFPFPDDPNGHGLLCINHEYVDPFNLHGGAPVHATPRPADQVRKEIAAHGVSVVEIKRDDASGEWRTVRGPFNRRITASTPMALAGPVRGSDLVVTPYSPDGTMTRGTLNNCAQGHTPWGTYLTCEENWHGYFVSRGEQPREQRRHHIHGDHSWHQWHTAEGGSDEYRRFDATASGSNATEDFRNEPNCLGWVVEIDPFDPDSVPIKRTALGRFAHEGCVLAPPIIGRPLVYYSGDDARHEYIYKFVTRDPFSATADGSLLDSGTLHVARFHEDGSGTWLPLDIDDPDFRAAAARAGTPFRDQADVLVNTRLAADVVGATPMDRPEWGTVHPHTREVYMTLTNNSDRDAAGTDAANPRGPNPHGHIIRWRERQVDSTGTRFDWDIFLLAGTEDDSQVLPTAGGPSLTADNIHASPDGLWVDPVSGILWIQTDMSGEQLHKGPFGANQMLAANPDTGEIRRFLTGPNDQEITGITATPDGRTLFVNVQHPGDRSSATLGYTSNWPDSGAVYRHPGDTPERADPTGPIPRSATLVITREDGGVVGV